MRIVTRQRSRVGACVLACCSLCIVATGLLSMVETSMADGTSGGVKSRSTKSAKVISGKSLDFLLKSKQEESWEKGLASVTAESLDDDSIVQALCKFARRESQAERFSPALVKAISFLAESKQSVALDQLLSMLNANDFRAVMATTDIVSINQDRAFLEPLMKLTQRREFPERYGFRRCVVDAIARYHDKSAVDFLMERLEKSDGQLKYEIALKLERATGQEFGGKVDDWKTWWGANRGNFVFASRAEPAESVVIDVPPKKIPWDEPRPDFYGMTIYAKRVVFVIDRSGSMASSVNGETRLAKAQQELQKAIKALSESDFFNIVAFDDRLEVFKSKLVPANEANKKDGIRFGYGLDARGETACYEPLKMGLDASNDLELMLFVSDGEPNSGALPDPSAIVVAISNHNLTQRTTIHTLGIDARDKHEMFLKELAEKNRGKLLMIR